MKKESEEKEKPMSIEDAVKKFKDRLANTHSHPAWKIAANKKKKER